MARRNGSGSASLRAAAISPNRSTKSARVSARADAAIAASSVRRSIMTLGAVAGVDLDVAFGQVAGPEAGGAFALAANNQADLALRRFELPLQLGLGEWGGEAGAADRRRLQVDINFAGIERDT